MTVGQFLLLVIGTINALFLFAKFIKKYANPYKLIMIFGKKGSGKSTLIAKLALQHLKKGWLVYSSIDLHIDGVRIFNVQDIGKMVFPEKSVVFIDEVGMIWDNRDFKNFRNDVRDYFKLQRHYKNKVYLFSQSFDIDVKLRNLTDQIFITTCHMNVFSIARRVSRKLVVVEPTADSEGRIADGYELDPLWLQIIGMRIAYFTFIPNYIKYFDSFEQMEVSEIAYHEVCAMPEDKLYQRLLKKVLKKKLKSELQQSIEEHYQDKE